MAEPQLTFTRLAGNEHASTVLIVGPSLGTAVAPLWSAAAALLADRFEVIGWDLPGHGRSPVATESFGVADLAAAVRRGAGAHAAPGRRVAYAGVSLGGAVALELAIEPGPFDQVSCIASAAVIGAPATWRERADLVRRAGTPVMVGPSSQRWFAPGFIERDPVTANRLLHSLADADAASYAFACEALAGFDVRAALADAWVPLLVAPGEHDVVIPPEAAQPTADAAPGSTLVVLAGCGHLPPAEDPALVAATLRAHLQELTHD